MTCDTDEGTMNKLYPGLPDYTGPTKGMFTLLHHEGPLLEWSDNVMKRVKYIREHKAQSERDIRLRHIVFFPKKLWSKKMQKAEAEWQKAKPDGKRARDQHQEDCQRHGRGGDVAELRWRREQAEGQEHGDLAQPRYAALKPFQPRRVPHLGIARDQAGDVDGEKAAPPREVRNRPDGQSEGDHHDRIERGIELRPVDDPDDGEAPENADHAADRDLQDDVAGKVEASAANRS